MLYFIWYDYNSVIVVVNHWNMASKNASLIFPLDFEAIDSKSNVHIKDIFLVAMALH